MERVGRLTLYLASFLWALASGSESSPSQAMTLLQGQTFARGENQKLFTEMRKRTFLGENLRSAEVWYVSDPGDTLAHKQLDYTRSMYLPDVDFRQPRLDYHLKVQTQGQNVSVDYKEGKKRLRKTIEVPAGAVMDGGIRNYLIANMSTLLQTGSLEFPLVVPEKGDWFTFRVDLIRRETPERVFLELKPKSKILALLAPSMEMYYDIPTRELIHYRGITDIKDAQGDNMKVFVSYGQNTPSL